MNFHLSRHHVSDWRRGSRRKTERVRERLAKFAPRYRISWSSDPGTPILLDSVGCKKPPAFCVCIYFSCTQLAKYVPRVITSMGVLQSLGMYSSVYGTRSSCFPHSTTGLAKKELEKRFSHICKWTQIRVHHTSWLFSQDCLTPGISLWWS